MPAARVAHPQHRVVALLRQRDVDFVARVRELDGVREQVPGDLLQAARVAGDERDAARRVDSQRDPARVGGRLDRVHRRLERHREVDRQHLEPHRAADHARHVEQVFDELRLHARVAVDDVERLGLSGRVERAQLEHGDPAEDGVERRAQLVRDRRHEFVLGAAERFGRAPGGLLALERGRALALGVALGRRVAKDDDDAEERAVGGPDRGGAVADRDLAPVARDEHAPGTEASRRRRWRRCAPAGSAPGGACARRG